MDSRDEVAGLNPRVRRPRGKLAGAGEAPEAECAGAASNAKGVRHLKGVQDINTGVSRAMHSVPPRSDRFYLDLYLLQMESERLNQEAASLGKRNTRIERRLAEINDEMAEKRQKATLGPGPTTPLGNRKPRQKGNEFKEEKWNRLPVDY